MFYAFCTKKKLRMEIWILCMKVLKIKDLVKYYKENIQVTWEEIFWDCDTVGRFILRSFIRKLV